GAAAVATHRDDCDGGDLRHAAAGFRSGLRIADAAATRNRGDWRTAGVDCAEPDRDAGDVLPDDTPARLTTLRKQKEGQRERCLAGHSVVGGSLAPYDQHGEAVGHNRGAWMRH